VSDKQHFTSPPEAGGLGANPCHSNLAGIVAGAGIWCGHARGVAGEFLAPGSSDVSRV